MPRIKIEMPEKYQFCTEIAVRIGDVNYGGHVGNDSILAMVHEGRVRFLQSMGFSEMDVAGAGIIMADSAIVYKSESFYGDVIQLEVVADDFNRFGCDIYYRLSNKETGADIAHAKTGIVFFDYENRKMLRVPEAFTNLCNPSA